MLTAERPMASAEPHAVLDRAMAFPMEKILDRYADEQRLPAEVAREHERELKRFLVLCALEPDASYGMAGPVDELWHTFITFTVEYARFCDDVGGRFIHHVPTAPEAQADSEGAGAYERMLEAYARTFGEEPPPEFWPRLGTAGVEGSACSPVAPQGSACSPVAPQGSACSPVAPQGSACLPAPQASTSRGTF